MKTVLRTNCLGLRHLVLFSCASLWAAPPPIDTRVASLAPTEIYGAPDAPIALRIANGGAGPTGLLRTLAEDYLQDSQQAVAIAWYQNITPQALLTLEAGWIDVALIYESPEAVEALRKASPDQCALVFYDHFLVVGPVSNPAGLRVTDTPAHTFERLLRYAETTSARTSPLFLSRDDGSGTNHAERRLWQVVGATPWLQPSPWYVRRPVFPLQALEDASHDGLYTLTDRGTWLTATPAIKQDIAVFGEGGPLLRNPCYAYLPVASTAMARNFLDYLVSARGQAIIATFEGRNETKIPLFTSAANPEFG